MRVWATSSMAVLTASTFIACAVVAACVPSGAPPHFEKPTAAKVAKLGVPIYPGARATRAMSEMKVFGSDATSIDFQTRDPAAKVAAFYASRLPRARKINFHLGGFQTYVFQYYAGVPGGVASKQVTVMAIADTTEIQIASSVIAAPAPKPSPT